MNANYGLMVKLKPEFQRQLFINLLKQYKQLKLASLLNRAPSLMYLYKNYRIKSLSLEVVNKAIKLANISKEELDKNTINVYSAEKERRKILDIGKNIRRKQMGKFKEDIPKIKEHEGSNNKDIAKVLKRVKMYSQLKFLENFGYIYKKDYPHKNYITMKGLRELQRGQGYV
ncbi:MAG: hypothetical protein KKG75_02225 [Nanoarchaeota archaeon]|nr:hypothetical protein [Nanoarchaeota archaeon]